MINLFDKKVFTTAILALTLVSCGDEETAADDSNLHSIKSFQTKNQNVSKESAEKLVDSIFTRLPEQYRNSYWSKNTAVPAENLELPKNPEVQQSVSVGEGPKSNFDITNQPIIANGKVFTLSGQGQVQARDINDIEKLYWEVVLEDEFNLKNRTDYDVFKKVKGYFHGKDEFLGGNMTQNLGNLYVATKRGFVYSINSETGKVNWIKNLKYSLRSSPAVRKNVAVVITSNNESIALNTADGKEIWRHKGNDEKSKLYSAPSAIFVGDNVAVPYSSGEMFLLDIRNGTEIWFSNAGGVNFANLTPTMNDIAQTPVFYKGSLLLVSSTGSVTALDKNEGDEIWTVNGVNALKETWPVDDFIYIVSKFGQLVAIYGREGKVLWKEYLTDEEDIEDDELVFTGAILAGDFLYVADNQGTLRRYNPANGSMDKEISIDDNVLVTPVVAEGKMFIINNDAELSVLY